MEKIVFQNDMILWALLILSLLFLIILYRALRNITILRTYSREINTFLKDWDSLTDYESGYLSNYEFCEWLNKKPHVVQRVQSWFIPFFGLDKQYKSDLKRLCDILKFPKRNRAAYNKSFIEHELRTYANLFNNIEGSSLDVQQREASIINEDNSLVIAGAGTGKTKTIMGKILYLFTKYQLNSSQLLLISFTNKSCDEMRERLKRLLPESPEVKTFHKLGLDIIKEVEAENHPSVSDINRKQFLQIIESFLEEHQKNKSYKKLVNQYFVQFLKPYKDPDEFKSEDDHNKHLIETQNYSFKVISTTTAKGEKVSYREVLKSQEEVSIANFLFFNQVDYVYESDYEHQTATDEHSQYKPDFYLPDYGVYIEHFAVNKQNKVPNWFKGTEKKSATEQYVQGMDWKRELHAEHGTTLVETYSWEQSDGVLLDRLKKKLEKFGVIFSPMSEDEKSEIIKNALLDELLKFYDLIGTFITLLKSGNHQITELNPNQFSNEYLNKRNKHFLKIVEPIFDSYQSFLSEKNEIDFSDMINRATEHIDSNRYQHQYQYILVDEFQDISYGRFKLLNKMLESRPQTKLFCVGDDWQSIYRFTGSDTSLISEFDKHHRSNYQSKYPRVTSLQKIETTYRFTNSMIDLSTEFIQQNDRQIKKNLVSGIDNGESESTPYTVHYYSNQYDLNEKIVELIGKISREYEKSSDCEILLLGRYNHDINLLSESEFNVRFNRVTNSYQVTANEYNDVKMRFLTVHSAKGLEAEHVILLNLNSGKFGFPSEITDDPVISMVLSNNEHYENAEERRVFYVALTRAKKHIHLMVDRKNQSKFAREINGNLKDNIELRCPKCGGIMVSKSGAYGPFYGCSNFPICEYTMSK